MTMLRRTGRLFKITNGFEAGCVIYALGLGAALRGQAYFEMYSGAFGWWLYAACLLAVLIGGAAIIDGVRAASPEANMPRRLASARRVGRARPAKAEARRSFSPAQSGFPPRQAAGGSAAGRASEDR